MFRRYIDKKNIALALGSGSAKGIAHIGVINKLIDNGCKIKAVAGTSAGAVIAAYYAAGKLHLIEEYLLSLNATKAFNKLDLSFSGGFIGGKKFTNILQQHLGDIKFDDLDTPLYVVATNFDKGCEEVLSSGSVIDALRASIAVPGVFKPHFYNGTYYVDGAITNPVPVDALYDRGYKNIIAVSLSGTVDERVDPSMPSILSSLSRTIDIVTAYLTSIRMGNAAAIITPVSDNIGMFDLHKAKDVIDEGSRATEIIFKNGKIIDKCDRKLEKIVRILSSND